MNEKIRTCAICGIDLKERPGRGRQADYCGPGCRRVAADISLLIHDLTNPGKGEKDSPVDRMPKVARKSIRKRLWSLANVVN